MPAKMSINRAPPSSGNTRTGTRSVSGATPVTPASPVAPTTPSTSVPWPRAGESSPFSLASASSGTNVAPRSAAVAEVGTVEVDPGIDDGDARPRAGCDVPRLRGVYHVVVPLVLGEEGMSVLDPRFLRVGRSVEVHPHVPTGLGDAANTRDVLFGVLGPSDAKDPRVGDRAEHLVPGVGEVVPGSGPVPGGDVLRRPVAGARVSEDGQRGPRGDAPEQCASVQSHVCSPSARYSAVIHTKTLTEGHSK
jgi:hypothetical protein